MPTKLCKHKLSQGLKSTPTPYTNMFDPLSEDHQLKDPPKPTSTVAITGTQTQQLSEPHYETMKNDINLMA